MTRIEVSSYEMVEEDSTNVLGYGYVNLKSKKTYHCFDSLDELGKGILSKRYDGITVLNKDSPKMDIWSRGVKTIRPLTDNQFSLLANMVQEEFIGRK